MKASGIFLCLYLFPYQTWAHKGAVLQKSERNAGGVKSHFPVQLRQPLQTGWQQMPPASCCLLFRGHVSGPS
jgi:hypothetical protein